MQIRARLFFSLVSIKSIDLAWQQTTTAARILQIDDYAFERDTREQLSVVSIILSVTQLSDEINIATRAFCSRNNINNTNNDNQTQSQISPFANIRIIDLQRTRHVNVSSCLLRQLEL